MKILSVYVSVGSGRVIEKGKEQEIILQMEKGMKKSEY